MISFVILNWNSGSYLEEAISSISGQQGARCEVIVVDNGSTNESIEALRRLRDAGSVSTLVELGENIGYAAGMNVGIERTSGSVVVPMNSDVVIGDGFASAMLRHVGTTDPDGACVGMVAVPVYEWDYEEGVRSIRTDRLMSVGAVVMKRFTTNAWHPSLDDRSYLMGPEGSVPVYTRDALEAAYRADGHYFEPGYFAYGEDTDLLLRVREAGFGVAVDPLVQAWHIGSASSGGALSAVGKPLWLRSLVHVNRYKTMRKLPSFRARAHSTVVLLAEDAFWVVFGRERLRTIRVFVGNYWHVAIWYRPRRLAHLSVRLGGAARSATSQRHARGERLPPLPTAPASGAELSLAGSERSGIGP